MLGAFPVEVELESTVSKLIEPLDVSVAKSGTEFSTELSSLIDSDTVLSVKSSLKKNQRCQLPAGQHF